MMRVLHIYDHTLPLQSGYVTRSETLRKAIEKRGIETDIISSVRHYSSSHLSQEPYSDHEEIDGTIYHRTKNHGFKWPCFREFGDIWALSSVIKKHLKRKKYDIIHAHSPLLNGYAARLGAWRAGFKGKIVYEIRAFWEDAAVSHGRISENSPYYNMLNSLETRLCRKVDHVYTICDGLKTDLVKRGIEKKKITLVPNVVNAALFKDIGDFPSDLAEQYGLSKSNMIIGFIGSFYRYEGLLKAIPVMKALKEISSLYKMLFVGGGQDNEILKALIEQENLTEDIILTGRISFSDIKPYYALCDAMFYPRQKMRLTDTTTPLKPLEAMAAEKIVFLSDIEGHRELVSDQETGFFFSDHVPAHKTAHLIHKILTNYDICNDVKKRALEYVTTQRSADFVAQKYYCDLIENKEIKK